MCMNELLNDIKNKDSRENEYVAKKLAKLILSTEKRLYMSAREALSEEELLAHKIEEKCSRAEIMAQIDVLEGRISMPSFKVRIFINKLI